MKCLKVIVRNQSQPSEASRRGATDAATAPKASMREDGSPRVGGSTRGDPATSLWAYRMAWMFGLAWVVLVSGVSSRVHLVLGYTVVPAGPPQLEAFLASNLAWYFACGLMAAWLACFMRAARRDAHSARWALLLLGIAIAPLLLSLVRVSFADSLWLQPGFAEPLWIALWTGLSFAVAAGAGDTREAEVIGRRSASWIVFGLIAAGVAWWTAQSADYYANFMLGYNDYGHFVQRLANTVAGKGWLVETPVLPRFWDHFNPGLVLLVPLWQLTHSVHAFFGLQAAALAGSGWLVFAIARSYGYSPQTSVIWCAAWLAQPSLGQMNLAYTYGWHPISMAIPALLASFWMLRKRRYAWAMLLAVLAMSMEEGVIVIVSLFCATCAFWLWWESRGLGRSSQAISAKSDANDEALADVSKVVSRDAPVPLTCETFGSGLSFRTWGILAMSTAVLFVLVYRFSGLAEFQTGRFVVLGDSLTEIALSPFLRPSAFWGPLFGWQKFVFVACLWIPCNVLSLWNGRRWLLATLLPLLLLLVWDHRPASSLAFQYPSALLPIFWVAAISGGRAQKPFAASIGALASGLLLSLFVGQLPYSSPTLLDVEGRTYAPESPERRRSDAEDGQWLQQQLRDIAKDGRAVLATGRIAAHVVGNADVETVGQYVERRDALSRLDDRLDNPIAHYQWIVLDRIESFQQSQATTNAVEDEAHSVGFEVVADRHELVILRRTNK